MGPDEDARRRYHLTRFAFLLSAARCEYDDEPVVGYHHDEEMSGFFSRRHLLVGGVGAGTGGGEDVMPPCISSSSLSVSNDRDCGGTGMTMMQSTSTRDDMGRDDGHSSRRTPLDAAALNMSAPFFTTPDTASSTAKTILKNLGEFLPILLIDFARHRPIIRHGMLRPSIIIFFHATFIIFPGRRNA